MNGVEFESSPERKAKLMEHADEDARPKLSLAVASFMLSLVCGGDSFENNSSGICA